MAIYHLNAKTLGRSQGRSATGAAAYRAAARIASTTTVAFYFPGTSGIQTAPSTTTPFTWTTSDALRVGGWYEAA